MNRVAIQKLKLVALKKTFDDYAPVDSSQPITKKMASQFNEMLAVVSESHPNVREDLPKEIRLTTPFGTTGSNYDHPDANYFDLMGYVEQLIAILGHLESGQ